MELEQRVKTLEYEFKILKNEVQRTLLDIQEQVLVHYYPSLRAEETTASTGMVQAMEAVRAKQSSAAITPAAKKVSLEQVREAEVGPGVVPTPAKLFQWSVATSVKFGSVRTQKLIAACSARGAFSADVRDTLTELTSLEEHPGPTLFVADDLILELAKLNGLLGRVASAEETLAIIKETNLG